MRTVPVPVLPPDMLLPIIGEQRVQSLLEVGERVRQALGSRIILNVNSTASGGGVAEMLHTLLGYARGVGIDMRWMTIDAPPEFFTFTKRMHHMLHGVNGFELTGDDKRVYEAVLASQATDLRVNVRPGDVVLLHDPQTAGLARPLMALGAKVAWRCHVGTTQRNDATERAWEFLRPYLQGVPIVVSQRSYLPAWVPAELTVEIAPSIDPLSTKNMDLDPAFGRELLQAAGLLSDGSGGELTPLTFARRDGSRGRVERAADVLQAGPPPPADAKLIVQISRWDPLKDMAGVMDAFADYIFPNQDCHLLLAGPNVTTVADDPEGATVLHDCMDRWRELPAAVRQHVHLACLPMRDMDENAVLVNALQREAAVVTQKSLAEGFGLTVTEAMWKGRPVVATDVGGIAAQITSGETGVLIEDPRDLAAFGTAVSGLLLDPERAARIGERGRQRVNEHFLPDRHLQEWAALVLRMLAAEEAGSPAAAEAATSVPTPGGPKPLL